MVAFQVLEVEFAMREWCLLNSLSSARSPVQEFRVHMEQSHVFHLSKALLLIVHMAYIALRHNQPVIRC